VVDLGVACAELGGVEITQRQGLLQDKARLRTLGAGQGAGALGALLLAAVMPQGRAGARVALARDHGADDPLPRGARHIAEGLRQLNVQLHESLWPSGSLR